MPMTTISHGQPVHTVIFEASGLGPERQREALRVIEDLLDRVVSRQPGFLCSHVHLSSDGDKIVNYQQWTSADAFAAFKNGAARDVTPKIAPFGLTAKVFDVAFSQFPRATGPAGGITLVGEICAREGSEREFRAVMTELCATVERDEPAMLTYRLGSADGLRYVATEHYRDSDAILAHTQVLGPFVDRIMAVANIERITVLGDVSPEAREVLSGFGAAFPEDPIGFTRL